jgi:hypothetical protein
MQVYKRLKNLGQVSPSSTTRNEVDSGDLAEAALDLSIVLE